MREKNKSRKNDREWAGRGRGQVGGRRRFLEGLRPWRGAWVLYYMGQWVTRGSKPGMQPPLQGLGLGCGVGTASPGFARVYVWVFVERAV